MPVIPSPRPSDPDAGTLFGTQVPAGRGPARSSSASTSSWAPSCPNPLISEGDALLALVPQLRSTAQIADVAQLRARIVNLLQHYDDALQQRGVAPAQAQKAHFVLCALVDEVVEAMPWGAGGRWERLNPLKAAIGTVASDSTVRQFAQLSVDRSSSRALRELTYVALALGFDARGRGPTAGIGEADQIRSRLAQVLKRAQASLSVRWQPAVGRASAFGSWLPLWVGTFVVGALLAVLYFSLTLTLASKSDRVFAQIAALRLPAPEKTNAPPAAQPRLLPLLSTATTQALQVRDEIDRSIVTVNDDTLFGPAGASLLRAGADALRPVAAALLGTKGQVLILGHTDGHSERSARFPSEWELSIERAHAVHDALLLFGVPQTRMRYDGRADSEPLTSAGPNQARAHSGRIEIVLLAGR